VLSGKVSKFSITSVSCVFSNSIPVSVSRVLRDHCQLKTESELTFAVVVGYFGVLVCCPCSMNEMLIHFSFVFDKWMTTPMPPLEPTDGSVVMGCTAPSFPPCSGTCCTVSATRGFPRTMTTHTISLGPLQSVIEVATPSRGKPSRHGRVGGVSRNVHMDLAAPHGVL
jgi:hypothetical protein